MSESAPGMAVHQGATVCPRLGVGIGLRREHYSRLLGEPSTRPAIPWLEIITENFLGIAGYSGGRPLHVLDEIRRHYPVVLHGVSLSIGSADPLNRDYLRRLKTLIQRVSPEWVSDHLCWTGVDGENLHDLLPLPFTREVVRHVASRIAQVQDFLGRRILVENVSSYFTYRHSEMTEWEFLTEVVEKADCGILLDVNNVFVSANNHGFSGEEFLKGIPFRRVGQFHLAGHRKQETLLVDSHDGPVADGVWRLYRSAVRRFGPLSTLIEWDDKIPELETLLAEASRARRYMAQAGEEDGELSQPLAPEPRPDSALGALDSY